MSLGESAGRTLVGFTRGPALWARQQPHWGAGSRPGTGSPQAPSKGATPLTPDFGLVASRRPEDTLVGPEPLARGCLPTATLGSRVHR